MDNQAKKEKYYSIMVVPHDAGGRAVSLKIPASWVYTAAGLAVFSLFFVFSSFVFTTLVSRRMVDYAGTIAKNKQQETVIKSFSLKTGKVAEAIDELVKKDNELRDLLGLKSWKSKIRLSTDISHESQAEKLNIHLAKASDSLVERERSLEELKAWVKVVRSRFASTPSTWPIYGAIVSRFGYRSYPWRGMHTGLDIKANYGAPVRVTANGVVSYVGWRSGYGKTVEINHGYGVSTLYAHNSNYAVKIGQRAQKGQVISYVGTTGWTTGPHLHYEVRRAGRPLNPIAYLNLNALSASRLWR